MPETTLVQHCDRQFSQMLLERETFDAHWQEIARFTQPRKGRFNTDDRNRGTKRHTDIYNNHASWCFGVANAGLLAGVMSPSRPWLNFEPTDTDLLESLEVQVWLHKLEQIVNAVFHDSNLYSIASQAMGDSLLFATGCVSQWDDFDTVSHFRHHPTGSFVIAQDDKERVNQFGREFEMTVYQMVAMFGKDRVSIPVEQAYDKGEYHKWYKVRHIVEPNPDADERSPLATRKAFRAVYYEPGNQRNKRGDGILRRSGLSKFPVYAFRWDVTGEDIYGTDCPGMIALNDVKGLHIREKRKGQAIDKMVNPPLHGPPSLAMQPVSNLPGGLTTYDAGPNNQGLRPVHEIDPRIQELLLDIQATEKRIERIFFVDLFMAISTMEGIQPKNEMELYHRDQERLLRLGPVLERTHREFLGPMVRQTAERVFDLGLMPPPPQKLVGQPLNVRFVSALAMAQRSIATGSIERLTQFVGVLAQSGFQEDAMDKFDGAQAIDDYAQALGAPPRLVRPDEQVAQLRAERQQMMQQQRMMEMGQGAANIAKMASDAKTGDDSVLTQMASAASGGGRR